MSRNAAPKVPGEPVAETVQQPAGEPVAETVAAAAPEETVTVSKASLDALMARVAALESQPAQARKPAAAGASLPDQDTINPDEIASPVLTKQGWVVPTKFGANPNAQKGL